LKVVEALAYVDKGIQKAREINAQVSLAVVDAAGVLVQLDRMDGASIVSPNIAEAKAMTALSFRRPSGEIAEILGAQIDFFQRTIHFTIMPIAGGLPLYVEGRLVGAIGVSGASAQQDEEIAKATIG
jgi:uncharacterized protein GlcG (DUF336 family)